jgi:hypothetical protein
VTESELKELCFKTSNKFFPLTQVKYIKWASEKWSHYTTDRWSHYATYYTYGSLSFLWGPSIFCHLRLTVTVYMWPCWQVPLYFSFIGFVYGVKHRSRTRQTEPCVAPFKFNASWCYQIGYFKYPFTGYVSACWMQQKTLNCTTPLSRPWTLPSKSFPIQHSSIILPSRLNSLATDSTIK